MTGQEMLDALENLDPAYIEAASMPRVKKMSPVKRWGVIAACLVLLLSAGIGSVAAEAKEYKAAMQFFDEYTLPTEGLTRGEIKAVYHDITNKSFTYEKTADVIENSLTPEQKIEYKESQGSSNDKNAEDLWDYKTQSTTVSTEATTPNKPPRQSVISSGITYKLLPDNPGGYTVVACFKTVTGKREILEKIDGLPVIAIGKGAFSYCQELTGITIPDTVTSIAEEAFLACTKLVDVTLSNNLEFVASSTFTKCIMLKTQIYDNATYLGSTDNPYMLLFKSIDANINSCQIHPETRFIYYCAFHSCNNLTDIIIPEGVISIGTAAFINCFSLENVSIPDSVAYIGTQMFSSYGNLVFNTYDNAQYLGNAANPYLVLVRGVIKNFSQCQIHPNTKFILENAFANCSRLEKIVIPDSVVSMGCDVFYMCTSLTDITIGKGVAPLPDWSYNYPLLTRGCPNLNGIWVSKDNPYFASDGFGVLYNKNMTALIDAPATLGGHYAIPDSVTYIRDKAFMTCNELTGITIGKNISYNFWSTFSSSESHWKSVSIIISDDNLYFKADSAGVVYTKDSKTLIYAPATLSGHYTISSGVTNIQAHAFYECNSLESITIPLGIRAQNLGLRLFSDDNHLKTIYYTGTESMWKEFVYLTENSYDYKLNDWVLSAKVIFDNAEDTPPTTCPTVPEPTENTDNKGLPVNSTGVIIAILVLLNLCTLALLLKKKKS